MRCARMHHTPPAASWKVVLPAGEDDLCCKSDSVRWNRCPRVLHSVTVMVIISGLQCTEWNGYFFLGPFHFIQTPKTPPCQMESRLLLPICIEKLMPLKRS